MLKNLKVTCTVSWWRTVVFILFASNCQCEHAFLETEIIWHFHPEQLATAHTSRIFVELSVKYKVRFIDNYLST